MSEHEFYMLPSRRSGTRKVLRHVLVKTAGSKRSLVSSQSFAVVKATGRCLEQISALPEALLPHIEALLIVPSGWSLAEPADGALCGCIPLRRSLALAPIESMSGDLVIECAPRVLADGRKAAGLARDHSSKKQLPGNYWHPNLVSRHQCLHSFSPICRLVERVCREILGWWAVVRSLGGVRRGYLIDIGPVLPNTGAPLVRSMGRTGWVDPAHGNWHNRYKSTPGFSVTALLGNPLAQLMNARRRSAGRNSPVEIGLTGCRISLMLGRLSGFSCVLAAAKTGFLCGDLAETTWTAGVSPLRQFSHNFLSNHP